MNLFLSIISMMSSVNMLFPCLVRNGSNERRNAAVLFVYVNVKTKNCRQCEVASDCRAAGSFVAVFFLLDV